MKLRDLFIALLIIAAIFGGTAYLYEKELKELRE